MKIHYDEKGKFFTDVITKEPVPVVIQTLAHRIEGNVHVRVGQRFKDELNNSEEQFLAVTEATIYNTNGETLYTAPFLTVNRKLIVWVLPNDEGREVETDTGGSP
jgi:hypothetical protein